MTDEERNARVQAMMTDEQLEAACVAALAALGADSMDAARVEAVRAVIPIVSDEMRRRALNACAGVEVTAMLCEGDPTSDDSVVRGVKLGASACRDAIKVLPIPGASAPHDVLTGYGGRDTRMNAIEGRSAMVQFGGGKVTVRIDDDEGKCVAYKDMTPTEAKEYAAWLINRADILIAQGEPGSPPVVPDPIPMLLWCPECGARHVDLGEFASKSHHSHACQSCGHVWRPAIVPTVGARFLPGFKNARCGETNLNLVCALDRGHDGQHETASGGAWLPTPSPGDDK